jgi:hypothetical protein
MNESPKPPVLFDFHNVPAPIDVQILETLKRIEVLLTPAKTTETHEEHKSKIAALQARVTGSGRRK